MRLRWHDVDGLCVGACHFFAQRLTVRHLDNDFGRTGKGFEEHVGEKSLGSYAGYAMDRQEMNGNTGADMLALMLRYWASPCMYIQAPPSKQSIAYTLYCRSPTLGLLALPPREGGHEAIVELMLYCMYNKIHTRRPLVRGI